MYVINLTFSVEWADVSVAPFTACLTTPLLPGARERRGSGELWVPGYVQHAGCQADGEQQNPPGVNFDAEQLRVYLQPCPLADIWYCCRVCFARGCCCNTVVVLSSRSRNISESDSRPLLSCSQVYSHGLRVIMKGQPPQEWRAPGKKQIEKACANERQVVLALAGGEIIFFELDEAMQNIQASTA